MEFTPLKNINRGYMKLDVWQKCIQLFKIVFEEVDPKQDLSYKLKAQILDAAQSISSNITEGYCRKSIIEYIHFLDIALGSSGELMTRIIGLKVIEKITQQFFKEFDSLHYEVENKLIALKKSLQEKQASGNWETIIREPSDDYM
jgi:four helix bundle protein